MQTPKKYHIPEQDLTIDPKEAKDAFDEKAAKTLQHLDAKEAPKELGVINIQPAPNRILVEKLAKETDSKILIPKQFQDFNNKGVIVKCGVETPEKPQLYKEGTVIFFPATATMIPIEQGKRKFVILNQFDVYAYEKPEV